MRGRIACLNTDLSTSMKQIETLLVELHSLNRVSGDASTTQSKEEAKAAQAPSSNANQSQSQSAQDQNQASEPCLWITDVQDGSPSADAGLLLADAILSFGDFKPTTSMTLSDIQVGIKNACTETLAADKVTIFVTVQRKSLFGES